MALGDVLALIREGEVLEKGTLTNYGYLVLREAKVDPRDPGGDMNPQVKRRIPAPENIPDHIR